MDNLNKTVFISILTRNQSKFLTHYLRSIDELEYDKKLITVYINTNNNDDDTVEKLLNWVSINYIKYNSIIFEKGIDENNITGSMGWSDVNGVRLAKMGKIRNKSLELCKLQNTDYYFVMDTDNWVAPITLKHLIQQEKPIIAPYLKVYDESCAYLNCHLNVEYNGYYKRSEDESIEIDLWQRKVKGNIEVPLVHCTYLIDCKYLTNLSYSSDYWGPHHYEYVLFSMSARANNIPQFFCTEKMFGFVKYETIIDNPDCYHLLLEKYNKDNSL